MVDSVNVENVGGDAGIASEVTLKRLLITMELMANKTGANSQEAIKKANEQYKKSIKDLDKATKEGLEKKKKNTKATEKSTKAQKNFAVAVGLATGTITSAAAGIKGFANELLQGGNELGDFTQHLPIIGSFLGPFASFIDKSISTFRELSTVGAAFGNSITEMRTSAVRFGLSLDELGALISSNSETIRVLGGTVAEGVKRFEQLNDVIKQTGDFQGLMRLGFTVEEVNEGLLSYVELQTRLGRIEELSTRQMATQSAAYMRELDMLAKVTGKSRKEVEATLQAQAQDSSFRALANQFTAGSEEMKNFQSSMAIIDNMSDDAAVALKDFADGVPQTEQGIALMNAAGPELMEAVQQIANGADPQVLTNALAKAGGKIEEFAGQAGPDSAAFLTALGQSAPALKSIVDLAPEFTRMGNINIEQARKEQDARDGTTETLLTFEQTIRGIREILQSALIEGGVLQVVADGAASLAGAIGNPKFKESIQKFADWVVGSVKDFSNFFSDLDGKSMSDTIADGIVGLFSDDSVLSAVASGISSVFGKIVDKIFNGDDSGPARYQDTPSGAGAKRDLPQADESSSGIGGLVKGIGAALGAAAVGITAFVGATMAAGAKPGLMAKGGLAIGGAITGIGAGIAGATWITDKTLPMFIESLKKFNELDASNLKEVGEALASLGKGFAFFAGAGFAKGLSAVPDALGRAFSFLTGADTPLEKIKEFGEADLNVEKITKNANALNAFGEAFQTLARSNMSDIDLNWKTVDALEKLGNLPAGNLESTARGIEALSGLQGLDTKLESLQGLDSRSIDRYRRSLEELVSTLQDLNRELAGGEGFGPGRIKSETTAGDVFSQMNPKKDPNEVNTSALLSVLEEIRDLNKRTLRAINEQSGNIH